MHALSPHRARQQHARSWPQPRGPWPLLWRGDRDGRQGGDGAPGSMRVGQDGAGGEEGVRGVCQPVLQHYTCIVEILELAVEVEEAEWMLAGMETRPVICARLRQRRRPRGLAHAPVWHLMKSAV
uniref:Uncharacterized protein n=1 Tax=Arundo donax TaxID=35708 RepID=A0A0A9D1E6_ARUDO